MALKCTVEDLREVEVIRNRAVIYARYSSDKQKEASIEQQVINCTHKNGQFDLRGFR